MAALFKALRQQINTISKSPWFPPVALAVVMQILFYYELGSYPLFDVDEPRYAETARYMVESGNWVTPVFNGELRLVKPVLYYWLIACSYLVFGVTEFAARFTSATAAAISVVGVYALGHYFVNRYYGVFCALVFATSVQVIALSRMSITDMTLSMFITLTTLTLFLVVHHHKKWWLLAGVFAGLGMLTKGPVALVLPGAVVVVYSWLVKRFKASLITGYLPAAILIAFAVALPWYYLAYLENGQMFLDITYENNFGRFTGGISYHPEPWYYFFVTLAVGFLPWVTFLPSVLIYWVRQFKNHHQEYLDKNYMPYLLSIYGAVWSILIFTFFSVSKTKLLTYIQPMFGGLALMVGGAFYAIRVYRLNQTGAESRPDLVEAKTDGLKEQLLGGIKVSAMILAFLFSVAAVFYGVFLKGLLPAEAKFLAENPYHWLAIVMLLSGIYISVKMWVDKKASHALSAIGLAMIFIVMIGLEGIVPKINHLIQGDMHDFLSIVKQRPVISYHITRPSLTYYARRPIPHVDLKEHDKLKKVLNNQRFLYIITKSGFVSDLEKILPENARLTMIDKRQVYSLLTLEATD